MNVFEAVKQSVTTRQAAERYGIRVGKNGMAVCPFHNDKNPSMKVDRRFHCFGCQADGAVIDFVSRLEAVSRNSENAGQPSCLGVYRHESDRRTSRFVPPGFRNAPQPAGW